MPQLTWTKSCMEAATTTAAATSTNLGSLFLHDVQVWAHRLLPHIRNVALNGCDSYLDDQNSPASRQRLSREKLPDMLP